MMFDGSWLKITSQNNRMTMVFELRLLFSAKPNVPVIF